MRVVGIDPGPVESAYVCLNDGDVEDMNIVDNHSLLVTLDLWDPRDIAIEIIESFGMAVGESTFTTVEWIGRFTERASERHIVGLLYAPPHTIHRISRRQVKLHLCNNVRAKDANVSVAVYNRFGGSKGAARGIKSRPGPLYGIRSHMISALAVALTWMEQRDA